VDEREEGGVSTTRLALGEGGHGVQRPLWRTLLGVVLGVILLAIVARGIDVDTLAANLRNVDGLWVGLALGAVLANTAAKVGRWRWLFPDTQRPGLLRLGRALLVGQMANALLPARVGDLARAFLSGMGGGVSRATALGTIAAEKAFDVLFLLICAGLTTGLASLPRWLDVSLAALAALGGSIFLVAVALPEKRMLTWIERWRRSNKVPSPARQTGWARRLPDGVAEWLEATLQRGLIGLAGLRHPRKVLAVCAWSVLVWALAVGTNFMLFRAFGLELSVGAALLLLTLLHVGMAPPSSPGRLGVFHALTVVGLQTFDVDRASGLAYATVLHAIVYGPQILLGSLALALGRGAEAGRR
jgi:uncharacterized protein (TIRG00374 family)